MNSFQAVLDPLHGPLPPRNRRRNPFWRFRRAFFVLALMGVVGVGAVLYVFSKTDLPEDKFETIAQTSFVCTAEVKLDCGQDNATAMFSTGGEDREIVLYDEISPELINAVVATEDQDFWIHRGFDETGILRAAFRFAMRDEITQGASTITQQYVKLAFDDAEVSLVRKGREIVRAIKLEQETTELCASRPEVADLDPTECAKREILTRYLNRAYFGRGASGVQAAARVYFGKDAVEITASEGAFLAGLLRNPSRAEPENHPDEANRRRDISIDLMLEQGYLTLEQAEAAKATPVAEMVIPYQTREDVLGEVVGAEYGTQFFVEEVRQQLEELYPGGDIYRSGLRVYTTLNQDHQAAAYRAAYEPKEGEDLNSRDLPELGPLDLNPDVGDPSAAVVSLDAQGRVVAMVGGSDYGDSKFNLATSSGGRGRQPGSTFKALALATAIEQGISATSLFPAKPGTLELGDNCADADGNPWRVSGGSSAQYRYRDLVDALEWSSNIVYAELVQKITPEQLAQTAQRLGITTELAGPDGKVPCSLVLGSQGVPVIEMASVFSTFERAGVRIEPVLIERVENANGTVICWYPVNGTCVNGPERMEEGMAPPERTGEQVMAAEVVRQVNYVMTLVASTGTGRRSVWSLDWQVAGKTGTSQQHRDAWFAGFTCDLTTVVWVGHDGEEEKPMIDFRRPRTGGGYGFETDAEGNPIDDRGWPNIEGGNFPTWIWNNYMAEATAGGPGCPSLEIQLEFTGHKLNPELSMTTLPPCDVLLDEYGFPVGNSPDEFQITTTAPPPPDDGGGGNGGDEQPEGLPAQDDDDDDRRGDRDGRQQQQPTCVPLNDYIREAFPDYQQPGGPTTETVPGESTTTQPGQTTTQPGETTTTAPQGQTTATTQPVETTTTTLPPSTEPPEGGGDGGGNGGGGGGDG